MARDIDALTAATLKHLRDRWWDEAFTSFVRVTLQPRAGNRILDVGCGTGTAEINISRLGLSQVDLCAVDLLYARVREALMATRARNMPVGFAAADACALPFRDGAFDSVFCVAVLQHVRDVSSALREFARVTKPGGRVLVVEPDNSARYWYSASEAGRRAFELGQRFFATLAQSRDDLTDPAVGPKLAGLFPLHGIQPLSVHLFPVSSTRLGAPPPAVWEARREAVRAAFAKAPDEAIRRLGADYVKLLDKYAREAADAGPSFVEIQNTMLFAAVGQKNEE
ncbi:MAG: methyltransferase domain-containing protein [Acidobacteria bacterium]|nr:methyltransferase domain-containing protein [Acidobacteriota bacterium]